AEDADFAMRLGTAPGFVQVTAPETFAYRELADPGKKIRANMDGAWLGVRTEKSGAYPGGDSRSKERRPTLTRHMRPLTLECVKQGLLWDGWKLYRATFTWNAAERRVAYLIGLPVLAAAKFMRSLGKQP